MESTLYFLRHRPAPSRIMSFSSSLARLLGSATAAILINQMAYRQTLVGEGNFFAARQLDAKSGEKAFMKEILGGHAGATRTNREWDTGLNKQEEETALEHLKRLSLVEENRENSCGTPFYRVDLERLKALIVVGERGAKSSRFQYFELTVQRTKDAIAASDIDA